MVSKFVAASLTAIASVGLAADVGLCVGSSDVPPVHIISAVFSVPLPLAPAADMPTPDQLLNILSVAQNPNIPFADKGYLVEGGFSPFEARLADERLKQAVAHGELPLTGKVANIRQAGPNEVTADFTLSGPKLTPVTQNLTFVDQGGWKVARASLLLLMQEAGASED